MNRDWGSPRASSLRDQHGEINRKQAAVQQINRVIEAKQAEIAKLNADILVLRDARELVARQ